MTPSLNATGQAIQALESLMERLRAPDGCPWDREQTPRSLIPFTIEEVYEVVEAIEAEDPAAICEELGDLVFHVVFLSQIAREAGWFDLAEVLQKVHAKMIRRHPHVFGPIKAATSAEVIHRWEAIKQGEKEQTVAVSDNGPASIFDGISSRLPALLWAYKIQMKMAKVGFDWPDVSGVLEKLHEEVHELLEAQRQANMDAIEEETGDLLFTVVNLARHLGINPESALRRATLKFQGRFRYMEQQLLAEKKTVAETDLPQLEELWQQSKQAAKQNNDTI